MLLSRAVKAKEADKRRALWTEIKKQLVSHERAELAEVYPALGSDSRTEDIARIHAKEAGELERTIKQIDALSFNSPEWQHQIGQLTKLVKSHVAEEEGEFFPQAQEVLGKDGAKQLEKPFMSAKEREMSSIY